MPLPMRRIERERPLERWDPFQELSDLRERIDRVFESFWRAPVLAGEGLWAPLADIEETDEALVVKAELPGVKKDDLQIEFSDAELVISGELKEEREGELRGRMRRTGRFEYRASLPTDVEADKARQRSSTPCSRSGSPRAKQRAAAGSKSRAELALVDRASRRS